MKTLSMLQKESLVATRDRHHQMSCHTFSSTYRLFICDHCGAHLILEERPAPNDIEVRGSAVAIECDKKGK